MTKPIPAKPNALQDETRYLQLAKIIEWLNALSSSSVDATIEEQRQRALKERQAIRARRLGRKKDVT